MIKIFIGCAPNHDDAESQAVLEYSIRRHASAPVAITWMKLSRDPASPFHGWRTDDWATPFSGFRYAVPALCNYEGRAIYMDSDVIVRADVAELWCMEIVGGDVIARDEARLCVSLWDCKYAIRGWSFDEIKAGARPSIAVSPFPPDANWNCLDGEKYVDLNDPRIKAIHYSHMSHQPHLRAAEHRLHVAGRKHWFDGHTVAHWRRDLTNLFFDELRDAESAGFTVESYCADPIYGDFPKRSQRGMSTEIPHWGR